MRKNGQLLKCNLSSCNNTIYFSQSRIKKGIIRYCSRKHLGEYRKNKLPPAHKLNCQCFRCYPVIQERKGENRECLGLNCKEEFYVKLARIKYGRGKYCSKKCMYKNMINKGNTGHKHTEESKKKMSKQRLGKPNFLIRGKPSKNRGDKHYNWKGGLTSLQEQIRKSLKYKEWRLKVFTRDSFICIKCKYSKGKLLEADHYPFSFAQIISIYNIIDFETALNCVELWNINNGRTLCSNCHKKTSTYLKPLIEHPILDNDILK